ncbi:succinate dehydrogenase, cytochrome b556 subunit [soil metagenome]
MSEAGKKSRPEFRNVEKTKILQYYKWPLASLASGAHRLSGFMLILLLPLVLYLLEKSLTSDVSFEHFKGIASSWFVKLLILGLCWAYFQHFCTGIRHLLMDLHIGGTKEGAKKSAVVTTGIPLVLTGLVALKLLGAF